MVVLVPILVECVLSLTERRNPTITIVTARVAQGALLVAYQSITPPNPDIFLASYIMDPAGLALLLFAALGFLGMA